MSKIQKAAQKRNFLKMQITGMITNITREIKAPYITLEEKEDLEEIRNLMIRILRSWDIESQTLGFKIKRFNERSNKK